MNFDVIIIGGGAAGLTAAIYTARKKLKTAVITIDIGGQTNLTNHIQNYPGYEEMIGHKLMKKFESEAIQFGAEMIFGKVKEITKQAEQNCKVTLTNDEIYTSKAIIIAVGKVPRELGIPGEQELLGRGIATCTAQDLDKCVNKKVAVIGGGNSALEAALEIAHVAEHVTIIHRRDTFRADEITVDKVKEMQNVTFILKAKPQEIHGKEWVESVTIQNNDKSTQELNVDLMFIEIGYVTATKLVENLVEVNDKGEIVVNERCQTSQEGIFAAGDATTVPFKQTVISAGEGAKAGLECYRYLSGGKGVSIDWD